MVKSPAHWEQPASDKASAAAEEKQLKPGKPELKTPRDMNWHKAAKDGGAGFTTNAAAVYRYSTNPAGGEYRNPPEHEYQTTPFGGDSGPERVLTQNRLASERK
jgi:hypothetical protein